MGLCKCPKRKTTSHFCFHHCVNVCEHCIVNNHTTCVVKSYTTWLKEASGSVSSSLVSASALCAVCQKQFISTPKEIENIAANFNDSKTAIRLLCYHIIHARCLSTYVKKQLKEGNILKCPSCARPLWLQQEQLQDSNNVLEVDSNELSPVALQLYKHLSDNSNWWGQAIITNRNAEEIEKYLLEDEESQKFEDESIEPQVNINSDISSLTIAQTAQSPNNSNTYYDINSAATDHTSSDVTTINYRSNTQQMYQPIHHRHFNNNYGLDSMITPQVQQYQQQQQCSSVNMTTNAPSSDLSNRHMVTSSTLLLLNDNSINNHEEQLDPSGKYRPKKFNNRSWSLNYQRLLHFCGTNKRAEENNTAKNAIIIIICMLIIVILLLAITSYTRSNNEPFDTNSIDYGGDNDQSVEAVVNIKSYNINNL